MVPETYFLLFYKKGMRVGTFLPHLISYSAVKENKSLNFKLCK